MKILHHTSVIVLALMLPALVECYHILANPFVTFTTTPKLISLVVLFTIYFLVLLWAADKIHLASKTKNPILTKQELARRIKQRYAHSFPNESQNNVCSCTSLGIAREMLGELNQSEIEYLSDRGGILQSWYEDLIPAKLRNHSLCLRDIFAQLPNEIDFYLNDNPQNN